MKVDSQNKVEKLPSQTSLEKTSDWEGKKVSDKPKDIETTKKSKTVFGKVRHFMKEVWKHKYKILLATLGVLTVGATAAVVAKKVSSKSMPTIKPDSDSEKEKQLEDKEVSSPKLRHLTLDRPTRTGIRSPTSHKPYEKLLTPEGESNEDVAKTIVEKTADQEQPSISEKEVQEVLKAVEEADLNDALAQSIVEQEEKVPEVVVQEVNHSETLAAQNNANEVKQPEKKASVATPNAPRVQKQKTRRQVKQEHKLAKKLRKYNKKVAKHPRKRSKYGPAISAMQQQLNRIRG